MSVIAMKHFDVLDYVDQCVALGMDERLAKFQARQMQQLLEIVINNVRVMLKEKEIAR